MGLSSLSAEPEKPRGVAAQNLRAVSVGDRETADARQHLRNAPDLVRVIAAGEDVTNAGELHRQSLCRGVEVDRIVVEALQMIAWLLRDVGAAFGECLVAAVHSLREIRDGGSHVREHPGDPWE